MPSRTSTILLAGVLGFASTTSQVMVIRELLVAFTGNELTIALTLAIWLLAVGAGSLLAGRAPLAAARMVPGLMITAGLASVAQVLAIRLIVPWVSGFGQLVTPPALAVLSAVGILPCAVTFGALFVGLVARASTSGFGRPIAAIYGSEAVGSAVAGVALAAFLLEASSPIAVAAVAALVLVAGAAWMVGNWHGRAGVARRVLPVCGLLGLGLVLAAGGRLDLATRGAQWRPLKVVATADSKYGSLVVTGSDSIFQFFETGTLTFTVPDLRYAEECAHLPLLCHPAPRSVLVLGGAGSGIVEEVLKHPSVKQVDFVELDPRVISIVKELAPRGWLEGNAHTAVRAYSGDAREFTARARTAYDVVIVGAGMPTSLLINRYYTREFFRSIRKVLAPDGVVAVKLASPGASVSPEMAELVASVRNALGAVFPNTAMLPGDYVHILASPSLDVGAQARLVMERLHARELHPAFVNQYVLWDWLAPIRVAQLDSIVGSYDHGEINSDDKPVAFALALSLWEKQMAGAHGFLSPPRGLGLVGCVILLVVLSLLVIGFFAVGCRVPASALGPLVMVYTVGLLTMFSQVLIIVAFQIASGYIYGRIAAVIAAYMAGMGLAAAYASRSASSPRDLGPIGGVLLAVPPLAVPLALHLLAGAEAPAWTADAVFVAVAGFAGFIGGAVFSAASAALASQEELRGRAGAIAYSLDLVGASIAGFVTGLLIIPAVGILRSACAVAATSLIASAAAAIATWVYSRRRPR